MKIQDAARKHEPFDVASGLAASLIADGKYVKYEPPFVKPIPRTTWRVEEGRRVEDYKYPPMIIAKCATCAVTMRLEGPTPHLTQKFLHCQVQESVPADIGKLYSSTRDKWKSRSRKVQTPRVPPATYLVGR